MRHFFKPCLFRKRYIFIHKSLIHWFVIRGGSLFQLFLTLDRMLRVVHEIVAILPLPLNYDSLSHVTGGMDSSKALFPKS